MEDERSFNAKPRSGRRWLDQIGIGLAGLCAVHCVATLILVAGLGIGGHFLLSHEIHEYGLAAAFLIAAIAIGWGAQRHRQLGPFLIALSGFSFMGAALFIGHGALEAVLTIIGVILVSIGHLTNIRAVRAHFKRQPA